MSEERPVTELVTYTVDDGVAWVVLNRPEARNALTMDMRDRIADLLEDASADLAVRAVVITGTGKGFCTGADLRGGGRAGRPRPEGAPERAVGDVARTIREGWQRMIQAILDCEKPVIAAVNGTAAGIGVHFALACDLVLAAEGVRFIEIFSRRGLVPDGGGAYLLPRLIGLHKTKELMFFGDDLNAEAAADLGLVNRVVPADKLEATAAEWAGRLAAGPTRTLGLTKTLLNTSLDRDRTAALADEAAAQERNMATHDAQEGVQAFVERRDPVFRGW
jgi:2-(1,2-epoxy-1,2-dihydrophenyl)acetyl-CoA isomerase